MTVFSSSPALICTLSGFQPCLNSQYPGIFMGAILLISARRFTSPTMALVGSGGIQLNSASFNELLGTSLLKSRPDLIFNLTEIDGNARMILIITALLYVQDLHGLPARGMQDIRIQGILAKSTVPTYTRYIPLNGWWWRIDMMQMNAASAPRANHA